MKLIFILLRLIVYVLFLYTIFQIKDEALRYSIILALFLDTIANKKIP